ncbi:flagellar type III secretion system pore protein FliP [Parerythrobacter jejuensis]|uniref:Flagellar biosynthetic protein FliP n=1 Tax=Parerythrobacter jejuensis TaxID=795812 RepID=A0A845AM82_9SPHN|nr:flagellar type III secretion system pore protein FliP [Parerythrobacter jejuensis]MXP30579.1 flagellar type III secretion system pore protein FliP [Parerythrobacter jejuensis]MXP33339.1 flagellar type III secretion system pore protein FliP [Parerythrobacter jejuensis]
MILRGIVFLIGVLLCVILASPAFAAGAIAETVVRTAAPATGVETEVTRTALVLTLLAIVPAFIVSSTSFLRIVVVLAMVRHAFGMPQTPPNIVLTSLALFMTAFLMAPTLNQVNDQGLSPFMDGTASMEEAMDGASGPIKTFMLQHTRERDIELVYSIAKEPLPATAQEVELLKLVPAFIMNELRVAFTIGFVILLPFLLIDLVVASILLSLGMMMVPPQTISLPIKVLMFILIDGWSLVLEGLLGSFG